MGGGGSGVHGEGCYFKEMPPSSLGLHEGHREGKESGSKIIRLVTVKQKSRTHYGGGGGGGVSLL